MNVIEIMRNNWQVISGVLTLIIIPMIKKLYSDFQNRSDDTESKLEELEKLYDKYKTDKNFREKPRFFRDEKIRKFKEFKNLNFNFFVLLVDRELGYWEVNNISRNLSPTFTYLKINDNNQKISPKNEKAKKILERNLHITQALYWLFFIIVCLLFIIITGFAKNKMVTFLLIVIISIYEIFLIQLLDTLKYNQWLKKELESKWNLWSDN